MAQQCHDWAACGLMLQSHDPMVKWLRLKKKKFTRSLFHSKKREEKNKLQLLFSFFPPIFRYTTSDVNWHWLIQSLSLLCPFFFSKTRLFNFPSGIFNE